MKFLCYAFIALFALISNGCKKEKSPLLKALDASTFECVEQESDYFFEGTLNGERVCYHVGDDDYEMALRKSTGFTSGAFLDPSNPSGASRSWGTFSIEPADYAWEHLSQFFQIETPKFSNTEIDKDSILKATIRLGDIPLIDETNTGNFFNLKLMILSKADEDDEGLNGQTISLQTNGGKQENSFLKVTELEITENAGKRFYTITFEFSCDLYTFGDGSIKYGRLEDGKFRIWVSVDK